MLKAGDDAPDFELRSHKGGTVRLSDFRGKEECRAGVSPAGVHAGVREPDARLRVGSRRSSNKAGAAVLGISIDASPPKRHGRRHSDSISYDLLSDFHPHGEVAQKYGVFRQKEGFSERAIFVIDKAGQSGLVEDVRDPRTAEQRRSLAALKRWTERTASDCGT